MAHIQTHIGKFRLSPHYQLRPIETLAPAEEPLFGSFRNDPAVGGVFLPRRAGLTARLLSQRTVSVMQKLNEDREVSSDEERLEIRTLLSAGLIEEKIGETFRFGPEDLGDYQPPAPRTECELLSYQAVRFGVSLPIMAAPQLSARLYFYNRLPCSPPSEDLQTLLSSISRNGLPGFRTKPDRHREWLYFENLQNSGVYQTCPFKVYISPIPEHFQSCFPRIVRAIREAEITLFKIPVRAEGLYRPDKIVVYLENEAQLHRLNRLVALDLSSFTAQGTPFTASIDDTGMLSYGYDPPSEHTPYEWQDRETWRIWITNRLASAILLALHATEGCRDSAFRFALYRIQQEGISLPDWSPTHLFKEKICDSPLGSIHPR